MKMYFYKLGDREYGPVTLDELIELGVEKGTMLKSASDGDWKPAFVMFHQFQSKIWGETEHPSNRVDLPNNTNNPLLLFTNSAIDQQVGVNNKRSFQIACYSGLFVLVCSIVLPWSPFTLVGLIITFSVSVFSWFQFKHYLNLIGAESAAKSVRLIVWSQLIFSISCLIGLIVDWSQLYFDNTWGWIVYAFNFFNGNSSTESLSFELQKYFLASILMLIISINLLWIPGYKIIVANSKSPYPIKRIGFSIICILPIQYAVYLKDYMSPSDSFSFLGGVFVLIPCAFLVHHFYAITK